MPRSPAVLRPTDVLHWFISRRRPVAAGLLAFAVVIGLSAVVDQHRPASVVAVAARDLPSGHSLEERDLALIEVPTTAVASSMVARTTDLVGRVLIGPVARGEPVTTTRVMSARSMNGLAVPVRLSDPGVATLLRPGDVIDVMAVGRDGQVAETVARRVQVITVPDVAGSVAMHDGSLIVVSTDAATAPRLAAATGWPLAVVIHPGG